MICTYTVDKCSCKNNIITIYHIILQEIPETFTGSFTGLICQRGSIWPPSTSFARNKNRNAVLALKTATLVPSINEGLQQLQTKLAEPALQCHINGGVCHGHWGPFENCRPPSWATKQLWCNARNQQDSNVYLGSHDSILIIHALSVHTGYVTVFQISIKSILCLVSTEQKLPWSQHGKGLKSGHIETMENLFVWGGFASESAEPTRVQKSQHIKHAASVQYYTPIYVHLQCYRLTPLHIPCVPHPR